MYIMEHVLKQAKTIGKEIANAGHQIKKFAKKRVAQGAARVDRGVNKVKEKIGDNMLGLRFGKNGFKA